MRLAETIAAIFLGSCIIGFVHVCERFFGVNPTQVIGAVALFTAIRADLK